MKIISAILSFLWSLITGSNENTDRRLGADEQRLADKSGTDKEQERLDALPYAGDRAVDDSLRDAKF